jgi:hypothetical protein
MAGIIAVYSLVIAVLIAGDLKPPPYHYSLFAYAHPTQYELVQQCGILMVMPITEASCI